MAGAADAEVQLQVAVAVPGQRGHAVTEAQVQRIQRIGHLARTRSDLAPVASVDVALDPAGNDFAAGVVTLGVHDQR